MTAPGIGAAADAAASREVEVVVRLRKIEGQVRGLQHMVERGDTCVEVLTQIAATRAALAAVGRKLVECEIDQALTTAADSGPTVTRGAAAPVVAAVDMLLGR